MNMADNIIEIGFYIYIQTSFEKSLLYFTLHSCRQIVFCCYFFLTI